MNLTGGLYMQNFYLQPYDYTGMRRMAARATQVSTIPAASSPVLSAAESAGMQGMPTVPAAMGTPVTQLMQLDGALQNTQQDVQAGLLQGIQPLMCPKYGSGGQNAMARISGGPLAPEIRGVVYFMDVPGGTEGYVNVEGLPPYRPASDGKQPVGPHGFHIHEFGNCQEGSQEEPFKQAGEHWNPTNQPHGNHAGDFPVLFSNNGRAVMSFFTNKFKPMDVVGKAVIIHENPDDYRTQPSGNAGKRLACGVIVRMERCQTRRC